MYLHVCLSAFNTGDPKKRPFLFEDYLQADGVWANSTLMRNIVRKTTNKRVGRTALFTENQLKEKYGAEVARILIEQKEKAMKKQTT